jgi:hypothetical protein
MNKAGENFSTDITKWYGYPMGPVLRSYLGVTADVYQGHADLDGAPLASGRPEDAVAEDFGRFLEGFFKTQKVDDESGLIDLLDELVAMDQPQAAITLFDSNRELWSGEDFRGQLAIGISAMLIGDLEMAATHFRAAQAIMPKEPAPYVNLVQILRFEERAEEAMTWCMAGIDADPNNLKLWDLYAVLCRDQSEEFFGERVLETARRRASWAGLALAADIIKTADPFYKLSLLDPIYHQGERDTQFLVELTAAMGVAGEYARIPQVVWEAERMASHNIPWQLYAHAAQAQLALGKAPECFQLFAKARRDKSLSYEATAALAELESEAREAVASGAAPHHDDMH